MLHCRPFEAIMQRREFITVLSSTAAWPLLVRAQQPAMPVIGFLSNASQPLDNALRLVPFREGLKEAGYVEDRNVASEYRGAEDHYDRLPELAADLLRHHPAVIVALGGPTSSLAAKRASTTVPVVFSIIGDPVELGLVTSFNRPGGNVTGVAVLPGTIVAKQFEALHEMVPTATVLPAEPEQSENGVRCEGSARSCACAWAGTPNPPCSRRNRNRAGFLNACAKACRWTGRRPRRILQQPARTTRHTGGAPYDAGDILTS
jgi:ABC transporter substrate binding protein